jgi:hypothetical protein
MLAATARQHDLAEYTRWEFGPAEASRMETKLLTEFEAMPGKRLVGRRISGWTQRLFGREGVGIAAAPALLAEETQCVAPTPGPSPYHPGTSMAALPALRDECGGKGVPSLSALPTVGRA